MKIWDKEAKGPKPIRERESVVDEIWKLRNRRRGWEVEDGFEEVRKSIKTKKRESQVISILSSNLTKAISREGAIVLRLQELRDIKERMSLKGWERKVNWKKNHSNVSEDMIGGLRECKRLRCSEFCDRQRVCMDGWMDWRVVEGIDGSHVWGERAWGWMIWVEVRESNEWNEKRNRFKNLKKSNWRWSQNYWWGLQRERERQLD